LCGHVDNSMARIDKSVALRLARSSRIHPKRTRVESNVSQFQIQPPQRKKKKKKGVVVLHSTSVKSVDRNRNKTAKKKKKTQTGKVAKGENATHAHYAARRKTRYSIGKQQRGIRGAIDDGGSTDDRTRQISNRLAGPSPRRGLR